MRTCAGRRARLGSCRRGTEHTAPHSTLTSRPQAARHSATSSLGDAHLTARSWRRGTFLVAQEHQRHGLRSRSDTGVGVKDCCQLSPSRLAHLRVRSYRNKRQRGPDFCVRGVSGARILRAPVGKRETGGQMLRVGISGLGFGWRRRLRRRRNIERTATENQTAHGVSGGDVWCESGG